MDIDESTLVFEFEKVLNEQDVGAGERGVSQSAGEDMDQGLVYFVLKVSAHAVYADSEQAPGEVCKFFLKGTCMKGSQCPYKHTRGERSVVCKHWLRGLCKKGDFCEFLHEYDLSKMPECYFYSKFGECSNPECMYLHINPEDKMKECPWYARGFCKHGPKCRHKHVKKTACANYLEGFCPDGPNCKFGHPKYELPKGEDEAPSKKPRTPMICHKCGSIGHKASACTVIPQREQKEGRPAPRPLESVTCFKCGQMGHYANHCKGIRRMHPQQHLPVN